MVATKKPSKAGLEKLATIAYPNLMGIVRGSTLFLLESKVSEDYRAAFPEATASRLVGYDLATPTKPVRGGGVEVYAPWAIAAGDGAVYIAAVTKSERKPPVMEIVVVDVREPLAPKIATTVATDATFTADSKTPILVATKNHLVFGSRSDSTLRVFDLSNPLAPQLAKTITIDGSLEAAIADGDGVLVTRLGDPMVRLRPPQWKPEVSALTGYLPPARVGDRYYLADEQVLAWTDASGKRLGATKKLGSTTIHVVGDGERVYTFGDALSAWRVDGDPVLIGKKTLEGVPNRITARCGIVCVPHRPDAKAADKAKAFACSLWRVVE